MILSEQEIDALWMQLRNITAHRYIMENMLSSHREQSKLIEEQKKLIEKLENELDSWYAEQREQ